MITQRAASSEARLRRPELRSLLRPRPKPLDLPCVFTSCRVAVLNHEIQRLQHLSEIGPRKGHGLHREAETSQMISLNMCRRSAGNASISPASIPGTPNNRCRRASDRYELPAIFCGPLDVRRGMIRANGPSPVIIQLLESLAAINAIASDG